MYTQIIAMLFIFNAIEYLTEAFLTPCVEQFIHKWRIYTIMKAYLMLWLELPSWRLQMEHQMYSLQ